MPKFKWTRRPRRDRNWVPDYDFDVGRVDYRIEIDHIIEGEFTYTKYRYLKNGKRYEMPKVVAIGILERVKNEILSS